MIIKGGPLAQLAATNQDSRVDGSAQPAAPPPSPIKFSSPTTRSLEFLDLRHDIMIQACTQTQVTPDLKTRHWLRTLEPDQTIQLISTTDDCYRSDDEYFDDHDGTDSMATSQATPVSVGKSNHVAYAKQMEKNKINALEIDLEVYDLDMTFSDEVCRSSKEAWAWNRENHS